MHDFLAWLVRSVVWLLASGEGGAGEPMSQAESRENPREEDITMCDDRRERTLEFLAEHLRQRDIRFGRSPDAPLLLAPFSLKQGSYIAVLSTDGSLFQVSMTLGNHVPQEKRGTVAELLARINWKLGHGHFDIDFSDGEVRYRVATNFDDCELNGAVVDDAIRRSLWSLERFSPAIQSIVWNDASPEDALAMAEGAAEA